MTRSLMAALALASVVGLAGIATADTAVTTSADAPAKKRKFLHSVEASFFVGGLLPSDQAEFYNPRVADPMALSNFGFVLGLRGSYLPIKYAGIELEGALIPIGLADGPGATLFSFRAQLLGQYPLKEEKIIPFGVAGLGMMGLSTDNSVVGKDKDAITYVGAGVKYRIRDRWSVRGDMRMIFAPEVNKLHGITAHFEMLVGVAYDFMYRKKRRLVVAKVEPKPEPEPLPDPDPDHDGFLYDKDKCPKVKGVAPDGCPAKDTDKDGIVDSKDQCPKDPEDKDGFKDEDGCPDPDNDGDGIADAKDKCPNQPEDKDGFQDEDGCPDPDNDGDGIADAKDKCPNEKEVFNGVDDEDGCPDKGKAIVIVRARTIDVTRKIFFDTNKATIKRASEAHLKVLASALKAHATIRIRVEGHTDDVGRAEFNLELSQRRADAVMAFLVKSGIAQDRLEAKGFGEEKPLVPGRGRRAREKNRRVEFKIIGQTGTASPPSPAAPASPAVPPAPTPTPTP